MPVYKLLDEMPYEELLKWINYFSNKRPLGWRDDNRAYMLLRAQGVKESPEKLFTTLRVLKIQEEKSQENDRAVPKGKVLDMMLRAKNGDKSGWKPEFKK